MIEEMAYGPLTTKELIERQESGDLSTPLDHVVDAKALYDLLEGDREANPSDEGCRLWVLWIRERRQCGAVRSTSWCTTHDMLADALTKEFKEPLQVWGVMEGTLKITYSSLRNGVFVDPWKGLPPSKKEKEEKGLFKDAAARAFCQSYWNALSAWGDFMQLATNQDLATTVDEAALEVWKDSSQKKK